MMEVGLTSEAPPHSERFTQNDYDSLIAKQKKRKDAKATKDKALKGQDEAAQDDGEQDNAAQGAEEQDEAATDNNSQEHKDRKNGGNPQTVPITSDAWTKWVYSVRGIDGESYPFLTGQSEWRNHLVGLTKGSLNLEEWMACDKEGNTPPTSPLAKREEEIGLTTVYPTS
jgi:hypothetical protein